MKCKKCGKEFNSILSDYCPYCGTDNSFEDDSNFTFLMLVDSVIEDEQKNQNSLDEFDENTDNLLNGFNL